MTEEKLHPIHPGEVLLEEFLKPMGLSQNRVALEIGVRQSGWSLRLWIIESAWEPSYFEHPNFRDILNLQNHKGQVKPYQIRQFLQLVEQYNLTLED